MKLVLKKSDKISFEKNHKRPSSKEQVLILPTLSVNRSNSGEKEKKTISCIPFEIPKFNKGSNQAKEKGKRPDFVTKSLKAGGKMKKSK